MRLYLVGYLPAISLASDDNYLVLRHVLWRNRGLEPGFVSLVLNSVGLALGTEVTAPVSYWYSLEVRAADGAGLATTVSHPELEVGGAYLTAGAEVGIGAGSLIADGGV